MNMEASHIGPMRTVIGSWWLSLVIGVLLVALGLASMLGFFIVATALSLLLGLVLVITGILLGVLAFGEQKTVMNSILYGLVALAAIIAGVYLLTNPGVGLTVTTMVLALFFPVAGAFKAWMALGMRSISGWWWMLISGLVSIGLGVYIWVVGLSAASRHIGVLLGLYLLVLGFALIMLALATRGENTPHT